MFTKLVYGKFENQLNETERELVEIDTTLAKISIAEKKAEKLNKQTNPLGSLVLALMQGAMLAKKVDLTAIGYTAVTELLGYSEDAVAELGAKFLIDTIEKTPYSLNKFIEDYVKEEREVVMN